VGVIERSNCSASGSRNNAVGGRPALELAKQHRVELVDERARPVLEHVSDLNMVGNTEGKVHVGEAVAVVNGERAHDGSDDDALILLREPEHAFAKTIPLLNGEYQARS
jgi:hypothetical protein